MKRFGVDNNCLVIAVVMVLAMGMVAQAQLPVGSSSTKTVISDFRVPEFDANGVKKSEVLGRQAEILPDGQVKITDLKILMFKEGVVEATILADECTFDRKEKSAFSNSAVSIDRGIMKVTGRGFRWSSVSQRIEILNESRVVLKNTSVWKDIGRK
jgi:hypothetical protein